MEIGVLHLEFRLHGNDSLKGKRRVANSLKQKMRNKFNVSVAEVGALDDHERLLLSAVTVGNSRRHLEGRLAKLMNMIEAAAPEELVDSDVEFFTAE